MLIGMLADRSRPQEATTTVQFFGRPAEFPTAPYLIASVLNLPVTLIFGLYRGGDRYDLYFETFAEHIFDSHAASARHCFQPMGSESSPHDWNTTRGSIPSIGSTSMISGIVATIAFLLAASPPSDLSPETAALIARLARPAPASTPYTEVHFAKLLREPLTLHGQLDYGGAEKLGKRVDAPYKETTTIADGKATIAREGRGTKTFGLDHAPDLQGLLASFSALLGGDAATMNRYYGIDETIDEHHIGR